MERSSPQGKGDGQEKEPEQDQFQQRGDLATPEIDQALGDLVAERSSDYPYPYLRLVGRRQHIGWMGKRLPLYMHGILLVFGAGSHKASARFSLYVLPQSAMPHRPSIVQQEDEP